MHTKRRKPFLQLLLFSIVAILVLAGCSNSSSNDSDKNESASSNSDSEYPITIKHALGEAVIEKKPERVVTIQWGNQDVALALGVTPVGFSAANFGVQDDSGLLPWTKEKLDELGVKDPNVFQDTDGLDFEAISDAKPDVILAAYSGITQEDYDTLSEIAPVVAYPTAAWATTWREQVELNATGMGMKKEGEQLITDIEDMLKEKASKYPQIEGKKVVWVNFSADDLSKLHLYTPVDSRVAFLKELGLDYPDSVKDLITDPNSYSLELSAENVEALNDADVIVGYGNDELYNTIKADPLLGNIPAVKRGSVAFIASDTPLVAAGTPTPLSIEYTIDDYLELIGGAIDKINE
ncbi:iron-siderophore ABC transporter substrate-binding protein [Niallia taxi]|uniref:Iron-siderophore ABC transporter substrate-binding protein n=1 Tax=Niallia taxi TaxID=2499688 RepID=A0A437K5S7_9BACI|nr:iron-siderophore ABC transporter substrate-binding protein [Niallia taxi]MCM3217503.1 iron-siderophore ABC transporter substrate-binding protein [Niallia taxi]MDK8642953.1 iron-siderophore ABC transporter substrate-binding protein [Niallia taxi]MED4036562.1 iron-siderophore ABC transporter substrate-binding protein [Niallia taxi]MED4054309.1 iron-siderophore ABC transporter substrate-binding protein [Niallia taxi]MED4120416.1 iron-siderophore ABC transporter substrate-binding protein [Niall